jgi:predicted kinase
MSSQTVYLMRGLPSCGKSHTARHLAGETGIVCETDQFFYTQVGDDLNRFDYDSERMEEARQWNYRRFVEAVDSGVRPIVVDRGNGLNLETKRYASYAVQHGYRVAIAEPESAWWQEIRVLLKYKEVTTEILDDWAERLARRNRETHRTPVATIRRWMKKWRHDITVDDILHFQSPKQRQLPAVVPQVA